MKRLHLTASADNFIPGAGKLLGYLVNSHSSGTIKAWDNVVASGSEYVHDTITLAAGERLITFPDGGIPFSNGLSITVGGTLNAEVFIA